jgi:hypothetical protein
MRLWALPDTPEARAALLLQRDIGGARSGLLREHLIALPRLSLLRWMGTRTMEYLEEGLRYFMLDLTLRLMRAIKRGGAPITPEVARAIASDVPFVVPRTLPSRPPLTTLWNGRTIALVPSDLAREYRRLLARVQAVKAKDWRGVAAFGLELKAALPGLTLTRESAESYFRRTKPSDIVLDYLVRKHFRSRGYALDRETAKKIVHTARTPGRLLAEARRDLKRHRARGITLPRSS